MTAYHVVRPVLFRLDSERAHGLIVPWLRLGGRLPPVRRLLRWALGGSDDGLGVRVLGLGFANPVGVAAGFDKEGSLVDGLGALGFGHVEVGTVTPRPQPGNPRPRIFRIPEEEALVNRMGFPSIGAAATRRNLDRRHHGGPVVGLSVGKNKETPAEEAPGDFADSLGTLIGAGDYAVVNVSSPNTPGLRDLGIGPSLDRVLAAVTGVAGSTPLLVKLSPDLADEDLEDAVRRSLDRGVGGFVAVNTTVGRPGSVSGRAAASEAGGLSGAPLASRSLEVVRRLRRLAPGVPIVGVGGVASGKGAHALIRAGASLVQVYSGLVYEGPGLGGRIKRELRGLLARDGFPDVAAAVGVDA